MQGVLGIFRPHETLLHDGLGFEVERAYLLGQRDRMLLVEKQILVGVDHAAQEGRQRALVFLRIARHETRHDPTAVFGQVGLGEAADVEERCGSFFGGGHFGS